LQSSKWYTFGLQFGIFMRYYLHIRTQKQIDTIDYAVNSGDIHSMIALIEFKGIGLKTMEQCFKLVMQSQPSQTLFD